MQIKNTFKHLIAIGLLAVGFLSANAQAQTAPAGSGKTELLWLGQAGFRIKTPGGKIIVIDPWLTGGPKHQRLTKQTLPLWEKSTSCWSPTVTWTI